MHVDSDKNKYMYIAMINDRKMACYPILEQKLCISAMDNSLKRNRTQIF